MCEAGEVCECKDANCVCVSSSVWGIREEGYSRRGALLFIICNNHAVTINVLSVHCTAFEWNFAMLPKNTAYLLENKYTNEGNCCQQLKC